MKFLKSILVIIVWSICFFLTSIFLAVEFIISLVKFRMSGAKSSRYFKPRPIFPYEESKKG